MIPLFIQDAAESLILPDSVQKAQFTETVTKIVNTDYRQLLVDLANEAMWIGLKIVLALLVWWVGRWLIRKVLGMLDRIFVRKNVDDSLRSFLHNMVKVALLLLLVLTVVQMLGVKVTSILALFASATLAIGMALSGTM